MSSDIVIDDATLEQIEQEMTGDGVWIEPGLARAQGITAVDEARIEAAVAAVPDVPARVVLVEIAYDDARFQGNFGQLSAWLNDDLGGGAVYLGLDTINDLAVRTETFGDEQDDFYAARVASLEHPGDLVAQTTRTLELLDSGKARALYEEIPVDDRYPGGGSSGGSAGGADWLVPGGVVVGLILVGLALVAAWRRRSAGRSARRSARPSVGFALPPAVLRTVKAAEDRSLRQRAEAEVLALGEALGSGDAVGPGPVEIADWRQALDHYAAARSVLDRAGNPADVVGALVLARRGESARESARDSARKCGAGTPWTPSPGCWFNPLHPSGTEIATWRDGTRSVDVPVCTACAHSIGAGTEPEDVLDFVAKDETVHYFRLDLGAWSRTGYGSVEPDLLGALRSR